MPARVYTSVEDLDVALDDLPVLPRPQHVLLVPPTHFEVAYVINPHMAGNIGAVDEAQAHAEWQALRDAYTSVGITPVTLKPEAGLPDLVFCANQTLPYRRPDGTRGVVLSRMYAPQRGPEVPLLEAFFDAQGYEIQRLPETVQHFEGMGDALWHAGRALLWGGYGFRTDFSAYPHLSETLDVPVLALYLDDPDFYHLDTCLSILDERTALIYPGAFQPDGLRLIRHVFKTIIEAPEDEARHLFACNAHCPDGTHVFIQRGCTETNHMLRVAGFMPVELATDEFLKSGGSVFCMKQMFW